MMKLIEKLKDKDKRKEREAEKNGGKMASSQSASSQTGSSMEDHFRRAKSYKEVGNAQQRKPSEEGVRRAKSVGTFNQEAQGGIRTSHSFGNFAQRLGFSGHHENSKSWQVLEQLANEPGFKYDISQFEIIKQIGSGAFGRVLLCKHPLSGQKVVLKAIEKRHIKKDKQRQHLKDEKDALKNLAEHKCPFVVHAVGCFQDADCLYFVMEYVAGGELFAHLRAAQNHRFSEKRARFYICEVLLALQHMHEMEHIVYRDIKPENMLLDESGHVKIIDFGFAKHLEEDERTYTFCGTPDYLAPEVIRNQGYGIEADYWALGVLIYELLVGHAPFMTVDPRTGRNRYDDILAGRVSFPKDIAPEAKDLILALLEVDPKKRLGAHKGMQEIKDHRWFKGVDWDAMLRMEVKAPKLHKVKKGTVNIQGNMPLKPRNPGSGHPGEAEMFKDFEFTIKSADATIKEENEEVEEEATEGAKRGFQIGHESSSEDSETEGEPAEVEVEAPQPERRAVSEDDRNEGEGDKKEGKGNFFI
eukprot:comp23777_c0_seq1/m.41223 comp23777_c0_seq1/g.41223  ORF comp23777_c0_seq1/g.41223 comp23777_c0_seq1/m.41223 type:complete len:528 (-) comp23777_c0_seq1:42-1625(-)